MYQIGKVKTKAHLDTSVTELERSNFRLAYRAAVESIVLLENNGVLPLDRSKKIAMFGEGVTNTVKCGSGSGEVNERNAVSIYDGMKKAGVTITSDALLCAYAQTAKNAKEAYVEKMRKEAGFANFKVTMSNLAEPFRNPEFPKLSESDLDNEASTCIYVVSRISGESYDRQLKGGDYYLTETEIANIRLCAKHYEHLVLVINAGGMVDFHALTDVSFAAVVYMSMLGSAGGEAVASVLLGDVSPSGRLSATWAEKYEDNSCANEYSYLNGETEQEIYKEGIYVGYRYFDSFRIAPRYEFGHGLSYTEFSISSGAAVEEDYIMVETSVKNVGYHESKEVVQVYVSCPHGKLDKEYQRLAAFRKTGSLKPSQEEKLNIAFPVELLASFDESSAAMVLEKGDYIIRVGQSSRRTVPVAILRIEEDIITSKHDHICPRTTQFEELRTTPTAEQEAVQGLPVLTLDAQAVHTVVHQYSEPDIYHDPEVDALMAKLTPAEMAELVVGCGNDLILPMAHDWTVPGASGYSTYKFHDRGISDISFCDGPAGVRLQQQAVVVKGKNKVKAITPALEMLGYMPKVIRMFGFGKPSDGTLIYQYTTAFPVGTALAQTWNEELLEEVGRGVNAELNEYGVSVWLAPGLNIHRNPLCGRNYEYFSEDPLLSGKMAAALTRGAQCDGKHAVSLKHFFCNNQETNRGQMTSEVSERAIREIYLKGFEIGVREGKAKGVMTSYNRVNGVFSAVNKDAITKVLRNEWGFDGMVLTDWDMWKEGCDADRSMYAGVDILMQGEKKQTKQIREALKNGTLDEKYVRRSASQVLRMIKISRGE